MQLGSKSLTIQDETLRVLVRELGDGCDRVLELIHQLQLPDLQDSQKADILAELIAATIHLHTHCDEDFQNSLANELERLSDDDREGRVILSLNRTS
ncbi:hypothetical protein C7271_13995 [filamentous cyanobacterium CCP5]|nr:hypothetical protein C7271_13995 [filamentous cyanobacterium CCP5]